MINKLYLTYLDNYKNFTDLLIKINQLFLTKNSFAKNFVII